MDGHGGLRGGGPLCVGPLPRQARVLQLVPGGTQRPAQRGLRLSATLRPLERRAVSDQVQLCLRKGVSFVLVDC